VQAAIEFLCKTVNELAEKFNAAGKSKVEAAANEALVKALEAAAAKAAATQAEGSAKEKASQAEAAVKKKAAQAQEALEKRASAVRAAVHDRASQQLAQFLKKLDVEPTWYEKLLKRLGSGVSSVSNFVVDYLGGRWGEGRSGMRGSDPGGGRQRSPTLRSVAFRRPHGYATLRGAALRCAPLHDAALYCASPPARPSGAARAGSCILDLGS
jgi:hypothetical protein